MRQQITHFFIISLFDISFIDFLQFLAAYHIEIECILSTAAHLTDTHGHINTLAFRKCVHCDGE